MLYLLTTQTGDAVAGTLDDVLAYATRTLDATDIKVKARAVTITPVDEAAGTHIGTGYRDRSYCRITH